MFTLALTSLSLTLLAHDGGCAAAAPEPTTSASLVGTPEPYGRSLGLAVGATRLISTDPRLPTLVGFIWIEGAQRRGAFELALRVPVGAGQVDSPSGIGPWMVVTGGQAVARASVDLQDLRLLAGGQLSALYFLDGGPLAQRLLAGPGVHVGAERALKDGLTLVFRAGLDWFIDLSGPQRFAIDSTLSLAWRF